MSPTSIDNDYPGSGVIHTLSMINPKCMDEITHHLRRYVNDYYTATWNSSSDMMYIINECREVFNDFIGDTFECDHPAIFIEVYLVNPIILSDQVRNDICGLVLRGLNISIPPNSSVHELLLHYTYAYAVMNEWYFMNRIAKHIERDIELDSDYYNW